MKAGLGVGAMLLAAMVVTVDGGCGRGARNAPDTGGYAGVAGVSQIAPTGPGGAAGQGPANGGGGGAVPGQGGIGGDSIRVIDAHSGAFGGESVPALPAFTGVLQVVAGQLGGPGNLDGVGTGARFASIQDLVFDPDDNRLFVRDGAQVRAIDVATRAVTAFPLMTDGQLLYQRRFLYVVGGSGATLTKVSPADGTSVVTTLLNPDPPIVSTQPMLAWPDGDAFFRLSDNQQFWRFDPVTGVVTAAPLAGLDASSGTITASVIVDADTILMALSSQVGAPDQLREVWSIDIPSATARLVAALPSTLAPGNEVLRFDPGGQFAVLEDGTTVAIGAGQVPPFEVTGLMAAGPTGALLFTTPDIPLLSDIVPPPPMTGVGLWDRTAPQPLAWAGQSTPVGLENLGPASGVTFGRAPLAIATYGDRAYVSWALSDGLAVVDLTAGTVAAWTQPPFVGTAAVWPASDGTFFVTARKDCSVWQASPDSGSPALMLFPAQGQCEQTGGMPTNPANQNFVSSGLILFDGSLLLVSSGLSGLVKIDPSSHTVTHLSFYDRYGSGEYDDLRPTAMAIGADGLLYIVDGKNLFQLDQGLHTATVVAAAGASVAADAAGNVYTTDENSVIRFEIASGKTGRVAGASGSVGVAPGPLPGSLNHPRGLAFDGAGLLIGNAGERVVPRARFQ